MHARVGCVILALAAVAKAYAEEQVPACLSQLATPVYPPLARQARVQGTAELKFRVNPDGGPVDVAATGHPLLAAATARLVEGVRLDPAVCGSREFTVTYRYAFGDSSANEVTTDVAYVAQNEFRVTTNGGGQIVCILYADTRSESRLRRTLRRVLRR